MEGVRQRGERDSTTQHLPVEDKGTCGSRRVLCLPPIQTVGMCCFPIRLRCGAQTPITLQNEDRRKKKEERRKKKGREGKKPPPYPSTKIATRPTPQCPVFSAGSSSLCTDNLHFWWCCSASFLAITEVRRALSFFACVFLSPYLSIYLSFLSFYRRGWTCTRSWECHCYQSRVIVW